MEHGKDHKMHNAASSKRKKTKKPKVTVKVVEKSPKPKSAVGRKGVGKKEKAPTQVYRREAKNAQYIARCITLPETSGGFRFPTPFGDEPTATCNTIDDPIVVFASNVNGFALPTNNQCNAYAFRSPYRSSVIYDGNPTNSQYNYALQFIGASNGLIASPPAITTTTPVLVANLEYTLVTPFATCGSVTYQPHGDKLLAGTPTGDRDGERFLWMEKGTVVSGTITGISAASGATGVLYLNSFSASGTIRHVVYTAPFTLNGAGTTQSLTVPSSGYYNLSVIPTVGCAVYVSSWTLVANGAVMCHRSIRGFAAHAPTVNDLRVNAVSLMFTNDASSINKSGMVAKYQVSSGRVWTDFLNYEDVASAGTTARFMTAKEGMFTWMAPSKMEDFEMFMFHTVSNGQLVDCFYPLIPRYDFLAMIVRVVNVTGQDGVWKVCHSIEYQTDDFWASVDTSQFTPSEFELALRILKNTPTSTENPFHLKDIFNAIGKGVKTAASWVSEYGPTAIKIAKLLV